MTLRVMGEQQRLRLKRLLEPSTVGISGFPRSFFPSLPQLEQKRETCVCVFVCGKGTERGLIRVSSRVVCLLWRFNMPG